MRRLPLWSLALILGIVASGCGGGSSNTASSTETSTPAPAPVASTPPAETTAATPMPATSLYDSGPRAADDKTVVASMTNGGDKLFTAKGCVVCHGFGKKITCPDLVGVTHRRTADWMEHQILHPEVMTKSDPIAHQLQIDNKMMQMTNQHLTETEAKTVIAWLKAKDAALKK